MKIYILWLTGRDTWKEFCKRKIHSPASTHVQCPPLLFCLRKWQGDYPRAVWNNHSYTFLIRWPINCGTWLSEKLFVSRPTHWFWHTQKLKSSGLGWHQAQTGWPAKLSTEKHKSLQNVQTGAELVRWSIVSPQVRMMAKRKKERKS